MSDSLWPHRLQHARLPCPSLTPRAYSNSCPLCQWCHPTISSSAVLFSSHFQSFPASGSLPMSWFFTSGCQSIRISALKKKKKNFSFSISPSNEYSELISFRMDWLDLLAFQGILKNLLQHHSSSSVIPFSSCLQSFPASGPFPLSQFFASDSQSIGISASASALSMNIQDWFPLGWTGLISLQSKWLSRVFSNTTVQKHQCYHNSLMLGEKSILESMK